MNLFGPPTVTFCEKIGTGLVARPFYAVSNLAFFVAAFFILRKDRGSLAKVFAGALVLVGTLSTIYDIRPIYLTQLFDLTGMLIIVNVFLFYNLKALRNIQTKTLLFIQTLLIVLADLAIILFKGFAGNIVFGVFVLADIVTERLLYKRGRRSSNNLWQIGFLLFALGFVIWLFDVTKMLCSPVALLNGRAIFHYLTAGTVYCLYLFYKVNKSSLQNRK